MDLWEKPIYDLGLERQQVGCISFHVAAFCRTKATLHKIMILVVGV